VDVTNGTGAEQTGAERAGMIAFGDLETALQRETEVVAERFPNTDPGDVDRLVRDVFAELRDDSTVEAHLLAVTRNAAIRRLEAQGEQFEPATLAGESEEPNRDATVEAVPPDSGTAGRQHPN
jgi:hypothetical protein